MLKAILKAVQEVTQQVISYILGAVTRIFGPSDDDYPKTGVQPFEGDSDNNK